MINVADGATANAGDATLAGTQTFSGQKSFSTSLTASIISASSFISASHFSGDGSGLSNLPSTTHDGNFGTTPITASNFTASNAINSTVEAASGSFKYIRSSDHGSTNLVLDATNILPPAHNTVTFGSPMKMFANGYFMAGYFAGNTIHLVSHSVDDSGDPVTAVSSSFSKDNLDTLKQGKLIIDNDNKKSVAAIGEAEEESNSTNYIRPTLIMHPTDDESALIHKTAHRLQFRSAGGDPFEIYTDGSSNDYLRLGSTTTNATQIRIPGTISASKTDATHIIGGTLNCKINGGSF